VQRNKTLTGVWLLSAAALLALAGSPITAQTTSRPILYYYLVPGIGYVPVYASSTAPASRTSAPSSVTYGTSAARAGQPNYYTEDYPGAEKEKPDQKLPARIRVRLPANAEVTVNDKKTTSTGAVREYETPELDPERVYTYLVKAKWVEDGITVEKSVKVRALAGNRVTINFVPPARERPRPRPVVRATETAELPPVPASPPTDWQWKAPYP
jgi:uncharacterized protein (TIGR03000 family)